MVRIPDVNIDLSELNHTELVLLARWNDLPASRAIPRGVLESSLRTFVPVDVPIPLDDKRKEMSDWLKRWWDMVRMQVAKKVCPACEKCSDLQVVDCYTRNESNINPKRARR
jgi:hypothetical protein